MAFFGGYTELNVLKTMRLKWVNTVYRSWQPVAPRHSSSIHIRLAYALSTSHAINEVTKKGWVAAEPSSWGLPPKDVWQRNPPSVGPGQPKREKKEEKERKKRKKKKEKKRKKRKKKERKKKKEKKGESNFPLPNPPRPRWPPSADLAFVARESVPSPRRASRRVVSGDGFGRSQGWLRGLSPSAKTKAKPSCARIRQHSLGCQGNTNHIWYGTGAKVTLNKYRAGRSLT